MDGQLLWLGGMWTISLVMGLIAWISTGESLWFHVILWGGTLFAITIDAIS